MGGSGVLAPFRKIKKNAVISGFEVKNCILKHVLNNIPNSYNIQ